MEGLWRMYCHWREARCSYIAHTVVVYLHFLHDLRFATYYLHGPGLLDEYKTIHMAGQAQPAQVVIVLFEHY